MTAEVFEHGCAVELEQPQVLEKLSESLEGAVFNAFLETKLSVEVELGYPSVTDILSRTLTLIGVTQMENLENPFFITSDSAEG